MAIFFALNRLIPHCEISLLFSLYQFDMTHERSLWLLPGMWMASTIYIVALRVFNWDYYVGILWRYFRSSLPNILYAIFLCYICTCLCISMERSLVLIKFSKVSLTGKSQQHLVESFSGCLVTKVILWDLHTGEVMDGALCTSNQNILRY